LHGKSRSLSGRYKSEVHSISTRSILEEDPPARPLLAGNRLGGHSTTYQNGAVLIDADPPSAPPQRRGRRHSRSASDVETVLPLFHAAAANNGFAGIWPFGGIEVREECKFCFDEKPVSQMTQLHCGHRFCNECLSRWYTSKIVDGEIDLKCRYPDDLTGDCMEPLLEEEIKAIVSQDTFAKYERFKRMEDQRMRECPYCTEIQRGDPSKPMMSCNNCEQIYCYVHSNAHGPEMTCEEYDEKNKEEFIKNREAAGKDAKECPGCGILVQKSQGCNHMTCTKCSTEFCYVCGANITGEENVIRHYQEGNCDQFDFNLNNNPFFCVVRMLINIYMAILFLPMLFVAFTLCIPFFPVAMCRSTDKSARAIFRYWRLNYFFMCNQWLFVIFVASPLLLISLVIVLPFSLCLINTQDGCEPVRQSIRTIYTSLMTILMVALFFPLMVVLFTLCCCVCLARPAMLDPHY